MNKKRIISPSLLSANFTRLKEDIDKVVSDIESPIKQNNSENTVVFDIHDDHESDYRFLFKDEMEDGISRHWWHRNSAPEKIGINGSVKFLTIEGDTLHEFNPDFGQELLFNFRVGRTP